MAIRQLDPAVRRFFEEALAPSTKRTYNAGQHRYFEFCSHFDVCPIPINEVKLCYFVAHLGEPGADLDMATGGCYYLLNLNLQYLHQN